MTTKAMIRGYSLKQTAKYLETKFDSDVRRRSFESLPPVLRSQINTLEPGEWYPRDYSTALFRAIAAAKNDEAGIYQDLVGCGEFIASEATNTFLKLMMRIMSPTLFAKKVPEFWKRDQKGGYFEADVSQADKSVIKMKLVDVEGYDHIGIVSIGWVQFGMTALGKKGVKVKQSGWTVDRPGPREVEYEVTWS
jgi:hypothetical protein